MPDDCHVVPLTEYWYVPAPPVGLDTTIEPLLLPLQTVTFVGVSVAARTAGCVILKDCVAVTPHASVTVRL